MLSQQVILTPVDTQLYFKMVSTSTKSSTAFLLTINEKSLEFYQDIFEYLTKLKGFNYILVTEHLGQENKHYHAYVQYQHSKRLSLAKLHGAHVEKCYGSAQKNIDYCRCEDKKHQDAGVTAVLIDEEGTPRLKGGDYSVKALKEFDVEDELPDYRMYNTWKKIKRDTTITRASDFRKSVKVYFIQGPSGVGKTNKAIELASKYEEDNNCGTDFVKFVNGFYLGTTATARVAIYDDFRDSHMKPSEFINFIDYNKHWMNIKGDSVLNNYNLIIITSVQRLRSIYRNVDDEPRAQWERRIEVVDMFPPQPVNIGGLPVGYVTDFNQLEEYEVKNDWDGSSVVIH